MLKSCFQLSASKMMGIIQVQSNPVAVALARRATVVRAIK
jgi:hypothetical protein